MWICGAKSSVRDEHTASCQGARRDVEQGLAITLAYFDTLALQRRALDILKFKLDVLWAMNDAMATRYGVHS